MSTATAAERMRNGMKESERCATCGRVRSPITPRRESWGHHQTVLIPRTGDPDNTPWQMTNDLIVGASIYRNGGTCETSHLCDDCLRIGLRHLKEAVSALLQEFDSDHEASNEIADLTQRLGATQHTLNNLAHDHNRMQERLRDVLPLLRKAANDAEREAINMATWESNRQPAPRVV